MTRQVVTLLLLSAVAMGQQPLTDPGITDCKTSGNPCPSPHSSASSVLFLAIPAKPPQPFYLRCDDDVCSVACSNEAACAAVNSTSGQGTVHSGQLYPTPLPDQPEMPDTPAIEKEEEYSDVGKDGVSCLHCYRKVTTCPDPDHQVLWTLESGRKICHRIEEK